MSWKDYSQNPATIDEAGVKFIGRWEGYKNKAYKDSAGIPTIGIGLIRYLVGSRAGQRVQMGDALTDAEIQAEFKEQIKLYERGVRDAVKVKLNQSQMNALVSLCYNIGVSGFQKSSVVRELNGGKYRKASEMFLLWNKAGGKVVQGLVNRRKAEAELFLSEG